VHNSQTSLHTDPGCTAVNAVQTSTLVNSTDCSFKANSNSGCVVEDPDPNSYGAAFAAAGGGMFITEFAESGISYVVLVFTWDENCSWAGPSTVMYDFQGLVLFGAPILQPLFPFLSYDLDPISVAKPSTQLVARQREQRRYFNARQTRCELPIRSLQH